MHLTTAITLSIPHGIQCLKLCWKAERTHCQAGTKPIESPFLGPAAWAIMQLHVPLAAWDWGAWAAWGAWGCMGGMEPHELDGAAWSCKQLHELYGAAWGCMQMQ
eukprot:366090-Chlamydomonas_euryale.AAC.2